MRLSCEKRGFKILKCGQIPAKDDVAAQKTFYDDILRPLMERVKNGANGVPLFMDASHFVMGCDFLGRVYSRTRRFVRTFSGRRRFNVLGALDFVTGKVLTVTNDSYITATQVCEMLRKISAEYAGKTVRAILDNARCRKCQAVRELALELGIELLYIPPYSPNLNLIERFWKFFKGELALSSFLLVCLLRRYEMLPERGAINRCRNDFGQLATNCGKSPDSAFFRGSYA